LLIYYNKTEIIQKVSVFTLNNELVIPCFFFLFTIRLDYDDFNYYGCGSFLLLVLLFIIYISDLDRWWRCVTKKVN
jgi:hypothetical protein